jgi:hypothetical protein
VVLDGGGVVSWAFSLNVASAAINAGFFFFGAGHPLNGVFMVFSGAMAVAIWADDRWPS